MLKHRLGSSYDEPRQIKRSIRYGVSVSTGSDPRPLRLRVPLQFATYEKLMGALIRIGGKINFSVNRIRFTEVNAGSAISNLKTRICFSSVDRYYTL